MDYHLVEEELSSRKIQANEIIDFFREELWAVSMPLFSFSLSGNPDLLGQSVHYVAGGRGVAMGFNMAECSLQDAIPQMVYGPDDPSFSIRQMNYDGASQRHIIRTIMDALENSPHWMNTGPTCLLTKLESFVCHSPHAVAIVNSCR